MSKIVKNWIRPLLASPRFSIALGLALATGLARSMYLTSQKKLDARVPETITLSVPGNSAMETALGVRLNQEAKNAIKKKHSRQRFLATVSQTLERYPAIASAVVHSRLGGDMRIDAILHRPELEIRDRLGKRFIFGSHLRPVRSPGSRESVEGLGAAPIVLVMERADLRWDRLGRSLLRGGQTGTGVNTASTLNIPWLHDKAIGLLQTVGTVSPPAEEQRFVVHPPATLFFDVQEGLSFCLARAGGTAVEEPSEAQSSGHCTTVLVGHRPSLPELSSALTKLREMPATVPLPAVVDLRIPNRALIRSDSLAESTKVLK